jgi:protein TonB
MEVGRVVAACSALALHALALFAVTSALGPATTRAPVQPLQVALIRPVESPRPAPPPPPEPPRLQPARPPQPQPERRQPPKPAPVVAASPAPAAPAPAAPAAPAAPVAVAKPAEDVRPAAITVERAPAGAPAAPRVAEGVPAQAGPREAPPVVAPGPARIGPRVDASWAGNTAPPYPAMARRLGEEGEVRLDVHVGPDGSVLEVRLKKSSGSALLDRTAIETVKKWRFSPAAVDGRPVAEWYYDWKWVFRLES